jgi:membrane AbrB-like protein
MITGGIAGILGKLTALPAMSFVFPIAAVLLLKMVFDFAYIPPILKKCGQVLSGCYVGSGIFMKDFLEMRFLLVPVALIIAGYMVNCYLTGKLIKKTCGFTMKESMLITIPAGASDMALISGDLGIANPDIVLLQVARLIGVLALFPQVINLLVYIANK